MIIFEAWARPLLILHGVVGGALVGAATHHLWWCWGHLRGRPERREREVRMAAVVAALYALSFALGAVLYPSYRVRVRAGYFDAPAAVAAEASLRAATGTGAAAEGHPAADLAGVARLFDVKEHWAALGLAAALGLFWLARRAHPRELPELGWVYVGLSLGVCTSAWAALLIGLWTASFRALGAVT